MLTHPGSCRQGRTSHPPHGQIRQPSSGPGSRPETSLAPSPEVLDADLDEPAALDLPPHVHAACYAGGYVDRGRVQHFPSELVLAPVVVIVVGGRSLGHAAREIVPHAPVFLDAPVIVPGIPGPRILHGSTRAGSRLDVGDPDLASAAETNLPVRQGDPIVALVTVVRSPHPARIAHGGGPVRVLAGCRVRRGLRLKLIIYPRLEVIGLFFWQKLLHVRLGPRDGPLYLLVEVGGGDLVLYLLFGRALVGLDYLVALVVLLG